MSISQRGSSEPFPEVTVGDVLEALDCAAVVFDRGGILVAANGRAASCLQTGGSELLGLTHDAWRARLRERFSPGRAGARGGEEWWLSLGHPTRLYLLCVQSLPDGRGILETLREAGEEDGEDALRRTEERRSREVEALESRLEQVERFKIELTANVTHDLRTPIASIKAAVSGLLAGDVAYDPAALRETLTLIEEESDRLQRRVQNLLSMSKMEAGDSVESRDWVDLQDVVYSALESLRSVRADRAVKLDFPDDLPMVLGDYHQLQIAIQNLVENAFLYSPKDQPVEISARVGLGQVRLRVRDYGAGLMPDESEQIFEKFYRGRSARRIPGTGLGLPICRGIAEAHGGRLWAEHVPGGGVQFVVSLPLDEQPPELELAGVEGEAPEDGAGQNEEDKDPGS
ncbi:MAG: sensor histidine kinase [Armatimonadota bacterium]